MDALVNSPLIREKSYIKCMFRILNRCRKMEREQSRSGRHDHEFAFVPLETGKKLKCVASVMLCNRYAGIC